MEYIYYVQNINLLSVVLFKYLFMSLNYDTMFRDEPIVNLLQKFGLERFSLSKFGLSSHIIIITLISTM